METLFGNYFLENLTSVTQNNVFGVNFEIISGWGVISQLHTHTNQLHNFNCRGINLCNVCASLVAACLASTRSRKGNYTAILLGELISNHTRTIYTSIIVVELIVYHRGQNDYKKLLSEKCFGTINFVKITTQSLYKTISFACSLANSDKPVAATLRRKCSGGIFCNNYKDYYKYNCSKEFFCNSFDQNGNHSRSHGTPEP